MSKAEEQPSEKETTIFLENIYFFCDNGRYADSIELIDNSLGHMKSEKKKIFDLSNENNELLTKIIKKNKESTVSAQSITELFTESSVDEREKIFLINHFFDLSKNDILFKLINDSSFYTELENKISEMANKITELGKNYDFTNI